MLTDDWEDEVLEDDFKASIELDKKKRFYVECFKGAEIHWFFVQGIQAYEAGLLLPAILSFLNGIEASIRVATLIINAEEIGLAVEALAFPNENDFKTKLASKKPNRLDVEIVKLRNSLCHGNVWAYINKSLGSGNQFFTPECISEVTELVVRVSENWARNYKEYRTNLNGSIEFKPH